MAVTPTGAPAGPGLAAASARATAEKTARNFEAVFAGQVAKLMLESVEPGEFGGGHGEEMFRGVLADKLGEEMAKGKGLGVGSAVLDQILRLTGQDGKNEPQR